MQPLPDLGFVTVALCRIDMPVAESERSLHGIQANSILET
jgi:hypothetical protein